MQQNTIKQTENFGEIVGLLKKKSINFGTSKNSGKNYANGFIEVEVTNNYGVNVLKVNVMQMELKSDGEPNKNFKALQTINSDYRTIDENGREEADLIQVFVKVEENNYYSKDQDEIKEGVQLIASTNFDKKIYAPITRVSGKEQKAEITFGGMITRIIPNDATGDLKIEIVGANYQGQAIKHRLDVSSELAPSFRGLYTEGSVTNLHYLPINAVEVSEVKQEVAFGQAPSFKVEKATRKNLVVGGDPVKYDSDMTQEVVLQMLKLRDVALNQVKENALKNTNTNANANAGFGQQNAFGGGASAPSNPFGGGMPTGSNPFQQ